MSKKRSNKWVEGLEPQLPVAKAAKKTVKRRLRAVWDLLPDAAKRGEKHPEYIHQVRVATRRAMAALQGYAELLPKRRAAWMDKQLKRIRRRAGEARDFDVLVERLQKRPDAERMAPLIDCICERRHDAQKPIVAVFRKLRKRDFPRRIKRLLRRIDASDECQRTTVAAWARMVLARDVDAFFAAAEHDLNDINCLHQMRIEGKLLRYAIEHFAAALGPELRTELYPEIERIQGLLGLVNDHASALEHYGEWRKTWTEPEVGPLIDALVAEEEAALREARHEFYRWWTPQRAADLKQRFAQVVHLPNHDEVA
jgi:CHAD domain-containing protein